MIRTAAQLQLRLDRSLARRKHELSSQQAVILRNTEAAPVLRRAGVTLLYAHWEGFFYDACRGYLELVASKLRAPYELTANFQALMLRGDIDRLSSSKTMEDRLKLLSLIGSLHDNALPDRRLKWRGLIRLGTMCPERVRDAIESLGLDYSPFQRREVSVLRRIVKTRNLVAHGQQAPVDEIVYHELHEGVIELLDELHSQVIDASGTKAYES